MIGVNSCLLTLAAIPQMIYRASDKKKYERKSGFIGQIVFLKQPFQNFIRFWRPC
jgi:hypothetical protein